MDFDSFKRSLDKEQPPEELTPLLKALWFARNNDWNGAHEIAQNDESAEGSWVHAYLHRVEGDPSNALYWYRTANKPMPPYSLDEEWQKIVERLLADLGKPY